ncbi:MAG: ferrochelatase [Bdellovibrionales bacterium]|nr:ferrochelatase [Bdellovibrionales bacterium]
MKNDNPYQFVGERDYVHGSVPAVGVLVVNLGTPEAPTAKALRPYLREFLGDRRVIELPRAMWWLILNGIVLVRRPKQSAELYAQVWTKEGSPLRVYTEKVTDVIRQALQSRYGTPVVVEYAMRYGQPSVAHGLNKLRQAGARRILILPMYPQYSATCGGTVFDAVAAELTQWRWVPELRTIMQFHDEPGYIRALANSVRELWDKDGKPDKLVMSFHGIPKRYFQNGDPYHCHCQKTGRLLATALGLTKDEYIVSFQSLFGKEEWIRPYTDETMKALGAAGVEKVDAICPGFTADCLETLEEIDEQNRELFLHAGGKQFRYIPALNDRPDFVATLLDLIERNLAGWVETNESYQAAVVAEAARDSERAYRAMNE